jgi:hypothetical protein
MRCCFITATPLFVIKPRNSIGGLGLLRWLSVTLLSALLLSPLLKSFFTETKKPIVVLAQDQSESVAGVDLQGAMLWNNISKIGASLKNALSENYEVHELAFGDQVREGCGFQFHR